MAFTALTTVAVGDAGRASWANLVKTNLDDHEDRLGDVETSVDDHEDRLDSLESSSPDGARIYISTTTLTNDQIKALPTTPITLVSAPSINTRVKVHGVTYYTWFENGAYGNVDTTSARLVVQTSSGAWLGGYLVNDSVASVTTLTTMLTNATRLAIDAGPYMTNSGGTFIQPLVTTATSSVEAKAVQLAVDNNGAGNFTGGNVSNQLIVVLHYFLETVPATMAPFTMPASQQERRRRPPLPRRVFVQTTY